jgi:hypothetical protein
MFDTSNTRKKTTYVIPAFPRALCILVLTSRYLHIASNPVLGSSSYYKQSLPDGPTLAVGCLTWTDEIKLRSLKAFLCLEANALRKIVSTDVTVPVALFVADVIVVRSNWTTRWASCAPSWRRSRSAWRCARWTTAARTRACSRRTGMNRLGVIPGADEP